MIQLGRKVKDVVTGVTGVVVARTEWLYGCVRITFQPQLKEGKMPDTITLDEQQLEDLGEHPGIARQIDKARAGAYVVKGGRRVPVDSRRRATGGGGRDDASALIR